MVYKLYTIKHARCLERKNARTRPARQGIHTRALAVLCCCDYTTITFVPCTKYTTHRYIM